MAITQAQIDERRKNNLDKDGKCKLSSSEDFGNCLTDADLKYLVGTDLGVDNTNYVKPILYEAYRQGHLSDQDVKDIGYDPKTIEKDKGSSSKAKPDGCFEDLRDKLRVALTGKLGIDAYDLSISATFPDKVDVSIYNPMFPDQYYEYPYTIDDNGNITFGNPVVVQQQTEFVPVTTKNAFVLKDDAKKLVTGPVMIPDCPDCDYKRGEKVFNAEEIAGFCHEYNTKFRLADEMHVYGATGSVIGETVENYTLPTEMTFKNVNGKEVKFPTGTWMATTKITDDDTWKKIEDGTYKGYSGTYLSRKDAEELLKNLSANKNESLIDQVAAIKRTLIKDLKDPVPVTVSIVDNPCVYDAIFTSIKTNPEADKAGRTFSDATLSKFKTISDNLQNGFKSLMDLIGSAESERTPAPTQATNKPDNSDMGADKVIVDTIKEVTNGVTEAKKAIATIPTSNLDNAITQDLANAMSAFGGLLTSIQQLIDDMIDEELAEAGIQDPDEDE